MNRKQLLWLLPAALVAVIIGTLLALPGFVASQNHRPAMERFASSLTGRQVHIAGNLSLTLLPRPRLTAARITIAGPDNETIGAKTLALDISLPALLHGQLAAQTLDLDSPVIAFPWPLPGGPLAVAPPPWLAALHANLSNASITLGGVAFTHVNADLFTSQGGAVSIAGSGMLQGQNVTLSLALGRTGLDGAAPLAANASTGRNSASFNGALNGASQVTGQLSVKLVGKTVLNATVAADGRQLSLTNLTLAEGQKTLSGSASFNLAKPSLQADLLGQNLDFDHPPPLPSWLDGIPVAVTLDARNITLLGQDFPAVQLRGSTGPAGLSIQALTLSLPGGGTLAGSGALAGGALSGQLALTVPDTTALLAGYHLPPLPAWPAAHLNATLAGTAAQPVLTSVSGTLGADHISGNLVLSQRTIAGALHFDHLSLLSLAGWAGQAPPGAFGAELEITAAKAEAGPLALSDVFADAAFNHALNVRRISANLYGGLAAGSFALDADGRLTAAQGFAAFPSASPLASLVPPGYKLPPALLDGRLSLLFAARGPADALATSAVARLVTRLPDPSQSGKLVEVGDLTITASPVIDLTNMSAAGAFSLQYPEAILLARFFGLDQGLVFPGAGSVSLRASVSAAAGGYGLNDFVGNFGALNAGGRVLVQNGNVTGQITAGTVAIPPIAPGAQFPTTLPLQGKLALTAAKLIYAGRPLLGASAATLDWSGQGAVLNVANAAFGGGTVSGSLGMALSGTSAPAFTAKLQAKDIAAAAVDLPLAFPYPITAGTLAGNATLSASGFGLKNLVATLAGTAALTAANGTLAGFNLSSFANALGTQDATRGLYKALVSGATGQRQLQFFRRHALRPGWPGHGKRRHRHL